MIMIIASKCVVGTVKLQKEKRVLFSPSLTLLLSFAYPFFLPSPSPSTFPFPALPSPPTQISKFTPPPFTQVRI